MVVRTTCATSRINDETSASGRGLVQALAFVLLVLTQWLRQAVQRGFSLLASAVPATKRNVVVKASYGVERHRHIVKFR